MGSPKEEIQVKKGTEPAGLRGARRQKTTARTRGERHKSVSSCDYGSVSGIDHGCLHVSLISF